MKAIALTFLVLLSSPALALYVQETSPKGTEVGPDVPELRITFDEAIAPLGAGAVKEEHRANLEFSPGIECDLFYHGTTAIVCKLKKRLFPGTKYQVKVRAGFSGTTPQARLAYEHAHGFQTSELAITGYSVQWAKATPLVSIDLNFKIKAQTPSGTIQCDGRTVPVQFEPPRDAKGEAQLRVRGTAPLNPGENCVFYFDKPLFYQETPGSSIPRQKLVLDPSVASAGRNSGQGWATARCAGNSFLSLDLFSYSMPYLRCEFNEGVDIFLDLASNRKIDIEKFVSVTPKDAVKISYTQEGISLSNFRGPGRTYSVKISRSIPTGNNRPFDADVQLQVETLNNPPLLAPHKATGVLEKDGPWQVAYSALNITSAELVYGFITKPSDLGALRDLKAPAQFLTEKKLIPLKLPENENHLLPLSVKPLVEKSGARAGLFTGFLRTKTVAAKFQDAEALIFPDAEVKERREFNFGYLFTDLGLHVKRGRRGILVWVFSLKEGKPRAGVEVRVFRDGVSVDQLVTDKSGLAFFPDYLPKREEHLSVVATSEDDVSFVTSGYGAWSSGISRWDFNFGGNYWQEPQELLMDVVSERPLYLPGERVNLKLFVRRFVPDSLDLTEAGKKVKVSVLDSRGEEATVAQVELNAYGTGVVSFDLGKKAPTGRYSVFLQDGASTVSQEAAFAVEEFRKPEFKVTLDEDGEAFRGQVTYFKGGPVRDLVGEAAVLLRKIPFAPKRTEYERFTYPGAVTLAEGGEELTVLSRTPLTTDAAGNFTVKRPRGVSDYGVVIIEGNFKDENGGTISGRRDYLHNPYDLLPGIDLSKWLYTVGEEISPEVVALDRGGLHVDGVPMSLTVTRVDYIYERRLGSGNYFYYDSRREEKKLATCEFRTTRDLKACALPVKEAGYYEFTVQVADPKLRSAPSVTGTYVHGKGAFLGFEAANHDRINLQVEKTDLRIGDKLKVMAISPLSDAEALITLERDGILHRETVRFSGNVLLYEVPINDEKFIPGFYVSVVIVKGRTSEKIDGTVDLGRPQFRIGYKRIEVANTEKRLSAVVKTEESRYEPGGEVEATVKVRDHKGKGTQSELAIAVVDDALLSVSGAYRTNYDVLDTFYTLLSLGVENYQTLTQLIGRRTFGKKGANAGGGGGFEVRSDFKNTAYWVAQVETDSDGEHTFKFKLPHNLTTWKVIAVAVDQKHRFGFGETSFLATKSLMIEPALPNFLVEGDLFAAKFMVTNRSGKTQDLKLQASSKDLELRKSKLELRLADDERGAAIFEARARTPGEAQLSATVQGSGVRDGVSQRLPVLSSAQSSVFALRGIVGEAPVKIPLAIPTDARAQSLSVQYSTTALQGLDEVFRYVLGYPYGCWEQRLTKAYFLVQYEALKDRMSYRFPETEGTPKVAVQKLLDLAADYQTPSGGMRYYPGGSEEADVYLSIYTGHAFALMKAQGYRIDPKLEKNLRAYLRGLLTTEINWSPWYYRGAKLSLKAFLLSTLSELGEKKLEAFVPKIFADREQLDLFGLAYLTGYMASEKLYAKESQVLVSRLESLRSTEASGRATYRVPTVTADTLYKFWNSTDTRSVCAVLLNLSRYSSDKAHAAAVVRGVLEEMRGGRWYNTQENIFCFEALRRYVQKFEAAPAVPALSLSLAGKEYTAQTSPGTGVHSLHLGPPELPAGDRELALQNAKGEVYYSTLLRYETPFKLRANLQQGLGLRKRFFRLDRTGAKPQWDELSGPELSLKRGDMLKVVLDVSAPGDRYHVMLNDALAGCFEPVNTQLATTSLALGNLLADGTRFQWESPYYRGNGFEYLDLRLTAAQFYSRRLPKGNFRVEYLVQTIATGTFTMPESVIEEMYYPDVRGTEKGRTVVVTE